MIGVDRLILNERFIQVFKELEKKGEIVKNDRNGKGMGDFAEKILGKRGYGHIVRAFLNEGDKRVIDYKHIEPLSKHFDVNRNFMLHGHLPMFGSFPARVSSSDAEDEGGYESNGNIVFTSITALAGSGIDAGSSSSERLSSFSIPGVAGSGLYALSVEGDSMEPLLTDGEIVICKRVEYVNQLRENEVCVIKADGEVWIKYVQPMKNQGGKVENLKLISENHLEYDPFLVPVNESIRIYKVIRRISYL